MGERFGERLEAEFAAGRHLCVGIDPHGELLAEWGLPNDAGGAEHMGRQVVAAAAGVAACVKPQISFFERFGSAGFRALERVLEDAREADLLVISDVKRGDIGSTFAAYAEAWLTPGAPLESDAITVAAYVGFDALASSYPPLVAHGKGIFVLAATSNPEAKELQISTREDGTTVAAAMVADATRWNREHCATDRVGSVGVVLGATLNLDEFGIDTRGEGPAPYLPVLAPGFGHQGARIEDAGTIYGSIGQALLANESRGILTGGPQGLNNRIRLRAEALSSALG